MNDTKIITGDATLNSAGDPTDSITPTPNATTFDVISTLFGAEDNVCFRVFEDRKDGIFKGAKLTCKCGKYSTIEGVLKNHNLLTRGIAFVVNYGGQNDASITRINAQFVEMDNAPFEEQQKKIDEFPLPPSMVVKTQKSLHGYWFMDSTAEVMRFRSIQMGLVKYFDGDPMCVNESRAMRLPGFLHCKKEEPVEVKCISFHPERKYTQDQLAEVLPAVDLKPIEHKSGSQKGLEQVMASCLFLKHCQGDAATLSEPDWYAMITNLAPFEGGARLIHELSAPYPGYTEENTQRKINHFLSSGTKPITCRTICEKGFKCPNYGKCPVKAPAAWCFKPLPADVLQDILNNIPVKGDEIADIQAAQKFISDYLYNQDAATASVMINSSVKDHFKIKSSYLKTLNAAYKDASREYFSKKGRKPTGGDDSIPAWYVKTEKGFRFLPGILAKELAEHENVVYAAEQHYRYDSGVFKKIGEMEAQKLVQGKMLPQETRMAQIIDAEKQWRLRIQKNVRDLNPNPYIINIRNGLYNVLENKLEEHTPEYCSTIQLGINYDKGADCPRFRKFLDESMGGDTGQVALIQEMLGYFLIPVNSAQKCFLIVGVAAAGKSVLLRVLNDILLGKENVSNVPWQAIGDRFKTAELFGKLANIFADLPTRNIDDNGIFKALVGEDYLTVEKKNKDPFSFLSTSRLIFSCNSIPKNYGDRSEGFYRRLIIIRFNNTVPPDKRDPHLLDRFRDEADGIFQFALEGLHRLIGNHFVFSVTDANIKELQQYREDSDSVLSFIKECCEVSAGYSVGSTDLFNGYKAYCEDCGLKHYSQKTFVQQLIIALPTLSRDVDTLGQRRVINGIKLGEILD